LYSVRDKKSPLNSPRRLLTFRDLQLRSLMKAPMSLFLLIAGESRR
jgi:hypothetical protein